MESTSSLQYNDDMLSFEGFRQTVLEDYRTAVISREVSLLGRREVLTGKAKFGIFGDGKEVPQLAMAKFFQPGDFRSGYYRDQTFMFAAGLATVEQYFAQLYADPDVKNDPFSAGRQMNAHFATKLVDENGNWLDLANRKNISADMAPTASQMPRGLGLAFASKCFRQNSHLRELEHLSHNGNEVCLTTIGDASTSVGHFWETMNAAAVLQVPLAVFVWDDGYGISVPKNFQTTKGSISEALRGLEKMEDTNGIRIYKLKAWDYAGMCEVMEPAIQKIRDTHIPAVFHIEEITQPQGHSTSGSHERYKTPERLAWEREWDCLKQMRQWIEENALATPDELNELELDAKNEVKDAKNQAWEKCLKPVREKAERAVQLMLQVAEASGSGSPEIAQIARELSAIRDPQRRDIMRMLAQAAAFLKDENPVQEYYKNLQNEYSKQYNTYLYNEGPKSALRVQEVAVVYDEHAPVMNGYEVLNRYFDELFARNNKVVAFGE